MSQPDRLTPGTDPELDARGRRVIDANHYMVLATIDPSGLPRVSPVYYTPARYTDLYWISSPVSHHSRNIADRAVVSIVIFDSTAAVGHGEAVYLTAIAGAVPEDELAERCPEAFRPVAGARPYSPAELSGDSEFRLYRAQITECELHVRGGDARFGTGIDRRVPADPSSPQT